MKKIILLFFLGAISASLSSQVTVSYSIGYANYDMDNMKSMLNSIVRMPPASTIGAKNIDDFPSNVTHTIDLGYRVDMHEFGIKGNYNTTGGKLSKVDYSGDYSMRFVVNGYRGAFYYRNYFYTYRSNGKNIFSFFGEISPGIMSSKIKRTGHLMVGQENLESYDNKFDVTGFALLLQAGMKYYITSHIGVQVTLGYDWASSSKINALPKEPSVQWTGVRLNGGIAYSF